MLTYSHKLQPPTTKSQLISFLSTVLNHSIPSIESLGTGVVYAQLLHKLYPDFPIHSINDNPKTEPERFNNLKIVQRYLVKMNIVVFFPVDKMVGCRLQDNLEVAQLMVKHYFEMCCNDRKSTKKGAKNGLMVDHNGDNGPKYDLIERSKEIRKVKYSGKNSKTDLERRYNSVKRDYRRLNDEIKCVNEPRVGSNHDIITEIGLNDRCTPEQSGIESDILYRAAKDRIGTLKIREPVNNINTRTRDDDLLENCRTRLDSAEQKLKVFTEFIVQLEQERNFYYEKLLEIEKVVMASDQDDGKGKVLEILRKKR